MFLKASVKPKSDFKYVWIPVAIAEFLGCGTEGRYVIDCLFSEVTRHPLARILLIKKLPEDAELVSYPSFTAPIISLESECSASSFMDDARKVVKALEEGRGVDLITSLPNFNFLLESSYAKLFKPKTLERLINLQLDLIKSITEHLCLDAGVPPSSWGNAYMLMGVDSRDRVYLHIGRRSIRSSSHENFFMYSAELRHRVIKSGE